LLIRDVVGPENRDLSVSLWCSDGDGRDLAAQELAEHQGREADWLRGLCTSNRFRLFTKDFLGGRRPFPFTEAVQEGQTIFRLALWQAAEFLSKRDYADNWASEMNEEFCFWSFSQWKKALSEAGFRIVENADQPDRGSRSYVNSWIVEHRYNGCVNLLGADGTALNWPPSNMVIVAEKPLAELVCGQARSPFIAAVRVGCKAGSSF